LLFHAHALAKAMQRGSEQIGDIHPETLIRWDKWTSTWIGTERNTGRAYQVRVINRENQPSPFFSRALRREKRALETLFPAIQYGSEEEEFIALPLPGAPFGEGHGALPLHNGIKLIGRALAFFEKWSDAGLVPPRLSPHELRDHDGLLTISCLSPFCGEGSSSAVNAILPLLRPSCEGTEHLADFFEALAEFPDADLSLVEQSWRRLLARALTQDRHQLAIRWRQSSVSDRATRLYRAVQRLHEAFPAPTGRGVLGVDLEGLPLLVESTSEQLSWGPKGHFSLINAQDQPLSPREARRVLRARASAALNARLHEEHDADPQFTEAICAWLSSSMRLRAVRLMLEASFKAA